MLSCATEPPQTVWADMVHLVAAAASQSLQALIKGLNKQVLLAKGSKSQRGAIIQQEYAAVQALPGYAVPGPHGLSLQNASDQFATRLQEDQNPRETLEAWVKALKAWRARILITCDGSGYVLGDAKMPHFQELLPVRIMVNDNFVKDCLDSNDLVELFCCCHKDSAVISPTATVTLLRYQNLPGCNNICVSMCNLVPVLKIVVCQPQYPCKYLCTLANSLM